MFKKWPRGVFVVGLVLGIASFWLAALAVSAPGGSRGRGTAASGIALSIIGLGFAASGGRSLRS